MWKEQSEFDGRDTNHRSLLSETLHLLPLKPFRVVKKLKENVWSELMILLDQKLISLTKSPRVNDIKFWWTSSFTQWHADESQLVCWPKFVQVLLIKNIRSTYNKTLGWEPWSSGYGRRLIFQSQYRILDGHFFTFICCKVWNVCLKRRKNKKEAGDGTYIYNKNVHVDQQCIDQKCPKIH